MIVHYRDKPDMINLQRLRHWIRTELSPRYRQHTEYRNDAQLPPPKDWRPVARDLSKNDEIGLEQIEGRSWQEIPVTAQEKITEAVNKIK